MLPHFDRRIHVIPQRNLKLPWNWRIFFGLDHGYKNPTHGVWGAVFDELFIIIFHEYRKSGLTIPENAANILGEEKSLEQSGIQAIEGGWVDPTTHMRDGKNTTG